MSKQDTVKELLQQHGTTFCEEIGIKIEQATPSALFQWLFSANLFSARIGSNIAADAARALIKDGLTTPEKMKNTSWEERVCILNEAHYTRYQEKTSTFLGDLSELLQDKYQGDLNKLKEAAGEDHKKLRELLKEVKGMGDVGVDIFLREAQAAWTDLYPFADKKALKAAQKMQLPKDPEKLAELVSKKDFPRLVAALVRVDLEHDYQLGKEEESEKEKKKAAKEDRLEEKSKKELYEQAKREDIRGRSKMNKKELSRAIKNS